MFKRLIASLVCLTFSFTNLQYVHAQDFSINQLPVPGTMIGESAPFAPLALKGLIVNPQKPLEFQFIVDTGKGPQDTASVKDQANQLVKYFLAGLTIPEGDLWVNLSPYEKNRMVPEALGQTDLGRDLLAQDYILKQLTASLIYPEKDLGKAFWSRIYAKAQQQFGTTNVPVNTFNKVWILPDQAQVFENVNAAYVTKSTLKVMLDEDYLALQKHSVILSEAKDLNRINSFRDSSATPQNDSHYIASQIVREIVLPEITKEVNAGKNFAPLRQIYQALILAKWYKETIQNGLLDAVYTNKNKVRGVNLNDPSVKEQIYERYLKAYKKGAFNYIKEDPTPDGRVVPRKYFSGGEVLAIHLTKGKLADIKGPDGAMISLVVDLKDSAMLNQPPQTPDAAMSVARLKAKLRELARNSGLPFSTTVTSVPNVDSMNAFWTETLRTLRFDSPIQRRVEREGAGQERETGQVAFNNADVDKDILSLTEYDVAAKGLESIRTGEQIRPLLMNPQTPVTGQVYFMHRGVFASKADIQKAFYDAKQRFDITVIPPAIWGMEYAKTAGHYHDPIEKPEIYQVVSGEALWIMQKNDTAGNVIDVVTVRGKAGDIAIMLPGYGHVSVNLSETEPLVLANWLTWHQTSFYGSFKDNQGAVYYVVRQPDGTPALVPNPKYQAQQGKLPTPRQMRSKDAIPEFGLTRGEPIYNLVKRSDFLTKIDFLNHPEGYANLLTPEQTLEPIGANERLPDGAMDVVGINLEKPKDTAMLSMEEIRGMLGNSFSNEEFERYWPILDELGREAGTYARFLYGLGLPAEKKLIKNEDDLRRIGHVLIKLAREPWELMEYLYEDGVPEYSAEYLYKGLAVVGRLINNEDDLMRIGNVIIGLGREAGANAGYMIERMLPAEEKSINSEDDLKRIGQRIVLKVCGEALKSLDAIAGVPIWLNEDTGKLTLGYDLVSENKWERPLKDADKSVAKHNQWVIAANPDRVVYYGYRNVRLKGDTKEVDRLKLRFDITVLQPGFIGDEYIMTKGHQHPGKDQKLPGMDYPEFYEVWNGTALYVQQGVNPEGKFEMLATLARPGDKVLLLPNYSHRTVNIGRDPLVMANWISEEVGGKDDGTRGAIVKPDFSEIEKKNGYTYHVVKGVDGKLTFRHNPAYGPTPAALRLAVPAASLDENGLRLSKDGPMYGVLKNENDRNALSVFLRNPEEFKPLFKNAFQFIDQKQFESRLSDAAMLGWFSGKRNKEINDAIDNLAFGGFEAQQAVNLLVNIGTPAIPSLAEASNSKYLHTRQIAPKALGMILVKTKSEAALKALVDALKYRDAEYSAAQVLYAIGDKRALPYLYAVKAQTKDDRIQNIIDELKTRPDHAMLQTPKQTPNKDAAIVDPNELILENKTTRERTVEYHFKKGYVLTIGFDYAPFPFRNWLYPEVGGETVDITKAVLTLPAGKTYGIIYRTDWNPSYLDDDWRDVIKSINKAAGLRRNEQANPTSDQAMLQTLDQEHERVKNLIISRLPEGVSADLVAYSHVEKVIELNKQGYDFKVTYVPELKEYARGFLNLEEPFVALPADLIIGRGDKLLGKAIWSQSATRNQDITIDSKIFSPDMTVYDFLKNDKALNKTSEGTWLQIALWQNVAGTMTVKELLGKKRKEMLKMKYMGRKRLIVLQGVFQNTYGWSGEWFNHRAALAQPQDKAMNGGIDLNQINVLRNGKTVNVQFDPAQLNELMQGGFEGFTPVIINITHISSPFQLLGINPPKQEVLAKA
jgi:glucose-6-phosphate isomerase